MSFLKNHTLVSMPSLRDTFFEKSVILICEHNKHGAMGLIVNHPLSKQDISISSKNINKENFFNHNSKLYFGGPVSIKTGIVLHSSEFIKKGTIKISNDFSLTGYEAFIKDFSNKKIPRNYKIILGHAGWSMGQLENEIERGDRLPQATTKDFIFNEEEKTMWEYATKDLGIHSTHIIGESGVA